MKMDPDYGLRGKCVCCVLRAWKRMEMGAPAADGARTQLVLSGELLLLLASGTHCFAPFAPFASLSPFASPSRQPRLRLS